MQLRFWEKDEKSAAGSTWYSFSAITQYDGHIGVPCYSDSPLSSLPNGSQNKKSITKWTKALKTKNKK